MTDYRLSVVKVIPIRAHETLDYVWGASAIAAAVRARLLEEVAASRRSRTSSPARDDPRLAVHRLSLVQAGARRGSARRSQADLAPIDADVALDAACGPDTYAIAAAPSDQRDARTRARRRRPPRAACVGSISATRGASRTITAATIAPCRRRSRHASTRSLGARSIDSPRDDLDDDRDAEHDEPRARRTARPRSRSATARPRRRSRRRARASAIDGEPLAIGVVGRPRGDHRERRRHRAERGARSRGAIAAGRRRTACRRA